MAVASPYRRARLLSFMDPSAHSSGSGYQVMQSLIGLGSGHLAGSGLGGGQAQWGFLPNAHTDFIFSVIGEQLGIIGALFVLALLVGFMWLGIRAAVQSADRFGALVSLGIVAWIGAETLINVGAVVGVLPVTGIPLPFISFGGSSLVITMVAAGILLNVARQGESGGALRVSWIGPQAFRYGPRSVSAGRPTVIAGGGTGGHIVPSLQIARALVDRGHPVGVDRALRLARVQEATTWPTLEFLYTLLSGRGLQRSMRPSAWWANAGAVAGLAWACLRAAGSFLRRRPRVVVVVGGYASFPAGLAAVLTRVPLVCMTTDAVPGAVNGLLGRLRSRPTRSPSPRRACPWAHVTGTPVWPALATLATDARGTGRPAGSSWAFRPTVRPWRPPAAHSARGRSTVPWRTWPSGRGPGAPTVRSTTSPGGVTTNRSPATAARAPRHLQQQGQEQGQQARARAETAASGTERRPTGPACATGWCLSRTRCPTSTTPPTCALSGRAP